MKLLTKHTDYAIRALLGLAVGGDGYVSAKSISKQQGIPYQFLRVILQELAKKDLIESKSGPSGGVKLVVKPENINITSLIEIFQGGLEFSECLFREQLCQNRGSCVLRSELLRIEKIVNDEFNGITIQSLADKLGN